MLTSGVNPGSARRARRRLEQALLVSGVALIAVYAAARIHGEAGRKAALRRFAESRNRIESLSLFSRAFVDDRLWSDQRVRAYRESLKSRFPQTMAVLRIPRIGLEVPVLDGTDDLTLNRAVGRIEGTARPGEHGNVGIAGHRDGFFRRLDDVAPGDAMTLETLAGPEEYVVEDVRIVSPDEVSVLQPTAEAALTLVTCYPFYFVGEAPQRYIVRACRRRSGVLESSIVPRRRQTR